MSEEQNFNDQINEDQKNNKASKMSEEQNFKDEINKDQKNINSIHCIYCKSLILKPISANFIETEFQLPLTHQRNSKAIQEIETESVKDFWVVDDMFTFENIGFSNTIDDTKFLICADCEMGPVGYHSISTKKCFVALKRIKHES